MEQWACVDVPALPLQLLLLRQADWAPHPVAVVDEDKPQGRILWVNERAWRDRIRTGQRYAEGLSLSSQLRAGVVPEGEIQLAVRDLARRLRHLSPEVEPAVEEPGVFWLDASGFERLHPSLWSWAEQVQEELRAAGFLATVVVGFDRFDTYALAKDMPSKEQPSKNKPSRKNTRKGVLVSKTAKQERARAGKVWLDRLHLEPKLRDTLTRLGVETVHDLRQLPAGGVLERFGRDSYLLHRLVSGRQPAPLAPTFEPEPVCERFEVEPGEHEIDRQGLLFLLKQRLSRMQQVLVERGEAFAELRLRLFLDRSGDRQEEDRQEQVQPAEPTLDEVQLIDLLRLRIESLRLRAPVVGFELSAQSVRATKEQLQLFQEKPRRDLKAAHRALARLRAEFGEAAVVQAVVCQGHLPEARYRWQPLKKMRMPRPAASRAALRLVRRLRAQPKLLACQRQMPDGWFAFGFAAGSVQVLCGPYLVSGGWWRREQHREYYFAETRRGDLAWIYFDRHRRSWFVHGAVE